MKDSRSYKVFTVVNVVVLLGVVFVTLYPFMNIIAQSLSSESAIVSGRVNLLPIGFNIDTYKVVMSDRLFWVNYRNTVVYTVVATAISLLLTTMYAYAISRARLRGRGLFIGIAVFTMFFNGGIIPNYILISSLGMMNTMWAIVIPNAVSIFNLLVMKAFFENMPVELEEAAAIDGTARLGTFLRIALPVARNGVATTGTIVFLLAWGEFLYAVNFFLSPGTYPLSALLAQQVSAFGIDWPGLMALAVLTAVPILIVYTLSYRLLRDGLTVGAVK